MARELLDAFKLDAPVRLLGVGVAGLAKSDSVPADPAIMSAPEALTLGL